MPSRTKLRSEMEKALLWGAALLGCPVLGHSDSVCNANILKTTLKGAGRVLLDCSGTGNVTSLAWTRDGSGVPATPTHNASLLLEVLIGEAKGFFECLVQCGEILSHSASITLDALGREDTSFITALTIVLLIAIAPLFLILLDIGYCFRQFRRRNGQGGGAGGGANGHAMALMPLPNAPI